MNQGTESISWSALFKKNCNSEKLPNKPGEQLTRRTDARINKSTIQGPDGSQRKTDYPERDNYEYFNGKESCYGHYHLAEFRHNEQPFCCVAQYVTYVKAVLFQDYESAYEILRIRDPIRMASVGKQIKNINKGTWRKNCLQLIKQGHREKNPELLTQLINTHPKILVDANPDEVLWGIGLDKHDELAWKKNTWRGSNLLGYILTEVRDEIMVDKRLIEEEDRKVFLPELQKTLDTGEWYMYQYMQADMSKDSNYLQDKMCNFGNCFPLWNQRERTQAPFTRHDQGYINEELSSAKTDSQAKTVTSLLTEQLEKPGLVLVKEKSRKKKKKERRKKKQKAKTQEDVLTTTVNGSDPDKQIDGQEGLLETSIVNGLKNNDNKEIFDYRHGEISQRNVLQGTYRENEHGELMSENELVKGELLTGLDRKNTNENKCIKANNPNNTAEEITLGEKVLTSFDKRNPNCDKRNQLESTNDEAELQDYEVLEEEDEHISESKSRSGKENRPKPYVMAMLRETNLRLQNRRLQLEIEKLELEVELLREQKKNHFKK